MCLFSCTLVRSVAVHSMNTFFVFSVILEWLPGIQETKVYYTKIMFQIQSDWFSFFERLNNANFPRTSKTLQAIKISFLA